MMAPPLRSRCSGISIFLLVKFLAVFLAGSFALTLSFDNDSDTRANPDVGPLVIAIGSSLIYFTLILNDSFALLRNRRPLVAHEATEERVISVSINWLRDFIWGCLTGIARASSLLENTAVGVLTLGLGVMIADVCRMIHPNRRLRCIETPCIATRIAAPRLQFITLRSTSAAVAGLIAWCAPLESSQILKLDMISQAFIVGPCESFAQAFSVAAFNFLHKPERPGLWRFLEIIFTGLFTSLAGAVWLLAAYIPTLNGNTDMQADLSLKQSAVAGVYIASLVGIANWLGARWAPLAASELVKSLSSLQCRSFALATPAIELPMPLSIDLSARPRAYSQDDSSIPFSSILERTPLLDRAGRAKSF